MAFEHGITGRENPTSVIAASTSDVVAVYVGTAPVNMAKEIKVNEPILCYSYNEAVEALGYLKDFENYTLCEAIDSHFSKFGTAPVVFINVLDPKEHKQAVATPETITKLNNRFTIKKTGVIPSSVVAEGVANLNFQFDDDGYLVLIGDISGETVSVTYDVLKPSMVTAEDIIGGIDANTGDEKGLECIENVFPKYRVIPTLVLAPKFSTDSAVAAVMETKASKINGHFQGLALADVDTIKIKKYTEVPAEKEGNNLASTYLTASWPKVALGNDQYHISTQLACIIQGLASENDGVPFKSPSNKSLKADSAVLADGTPVLLGVNKANYLNSNGIGTALNFIGGWKAWGNHTSCFPAVTDPKDAFIASRLMFNFLNNTLVTTFWQKVDEATNKILINTIVDSCNIWLNGLTNQGQILGGRVEFREEDNPVTSLIAGKITLRIYFTPPLPAQEICFLKEIDVKYFDTLFQ
ncbi:MAG: phage tail sheath family protein [Fusobacteriaceae bacterium]